MSERLLKVRAIYDRLQNDPTFSVTEARETYKHDFGVPPKDDSIDRRYVEVVENHFGYPEVGRPRSWCAEDVSVPADIALALFLREISGRKSKTPRVLSLAQKAQMEEFQQLKDKIKKEEHLSAEDAKYEAARRIRRTFEWRGQRKSFLSIEQMLEWNEHPTRYGLPTTRRPRR
jgi:hypothetical protein